MAKRGRPRKNQVDVAEEKPEPCGLDALFFMPIAGANGASLGKITETNAGQVTISQFEKVSYLCVNPDCPNKKSFDCHTDAVPSICPFCEKRTLIMCEITATKEKVRPVQ